jgi:hypothetical protein
MFANHRQKNSRKLFFILPVLFLFFALFTSQVQSKQYGIILEDYAEGYASAEADRALEQIAATGVEWTSVLAWKMADNIDSTSLYNSSEDGITSSDDALIHAIQKAHSLGLKVMLYPHIELANDPSHWYGETGKNFGAAEWDEWFVSYTQFITHYAQLAAANGVEQLSLGSELLYAEKQEAYWRELISIVRQQYNGSLIYAENYDNETFGTTSNVRWWDALDYISIDAYYDLIPEENTHPTLEDMLEAWKPIVARLESYSAEWNKPILIPEMGYRSAKGSIHHPWDFPRSNTIDLQEQANAYEAFYKSFAHKPWFAGVLWWSHSGFEPETIENTSYSPINKPAEDIIRQYLN